MITAVATKVPATVNTATQVDAVRPNPRPCKRRTNGAIIKLKMMASAKGINTSRPTYISAKAVPPPRIRASGLDRRGAAASSCFMDLREDMGGSRRNRSAGRIRHDRRRAGIPSAGLALLDQRGTALRHRAAQGRVVVERGLLEQVRRRQQRRSSIDDVQPTAGCRCNRHEVVQRITDEAENLAGAVT